MEISGYLLIIANIEIEILMMCIIIMTEIKGLEHLVLATIIIIMGIFINLIISNFNILSKLNYYIYVGLMAIYITQEKLLLNKKYIYPKI